jgi:hypothetical protein
LRRTSGRTARLSILVSVAACVALIGALTPAGTGRAAEGVLQAGAASVDMTWHTGAGQGQYGTAGNGLSADKFDPFHHQTKMVPSDGMQSRTFAKAIVLEGPDGTKAAYVKTELYLQQDVLTRRVAELVSGDPTAPDFEVEGLDGSNIMLGGTHNHSAPHYTSTAWGVWLFTDTFDFRAFEHTARAIAQAIVDADEALVPAQVGASVTRFDEVQQNILGPGTADDGTPAGFPRDHFDDELSVIRFDAVDGSGPIAAWVNLGMHPESMETADLISADFVGMVERMVERAMGREPGADEGPVVAWSQGSVGDVEPDKDSRANPPGDGREYWHRNFAQAELMSRDIAAAVVDTWRDVADGTPDIEEKFVPFSTDAVVDMVDHHFAGPVSHPFPTISNCRTEHPGAPIVGLPDCERGGDPPEQYGTTLELLKDAGIPVPDNYSPPAYEGVQESLRIHLQALRIGDILVAACPCEPISDMVLNFKSRTNEGQGDLENGFMWPCEESAEEVSCNFAQASWRDDDWRLVDPDAYQLMVAQIDNDAAGWEEDLASLQGEVEARDVSEIYGNYTHEEIQDLGCEGCEGYRHPIMVGQANDYVGYVVTYREYSRGDHYRKALTAYGPHTSDYINTRLVRMAAELQGGDLAGEGELDPAVDPFDDLIQTAKTLAVGKAGTAGTAAYEAAIPDDGGTAGAVVSEPESESESLQRFDAATFTWEGGSNWTDNPEVVVQRKTGDDEWETVATQEGGEVVLTLEYDSYFSEAPLLWLTGGKVYRWTATWEAFERTTPGTYRFSVDGRHRSGGEAMPYEAISQEFDVSVWEGIAAHDLGVEPAAGSASFVVDGVEKDTPENDLETDDDAILSPDEIHYPDTYESDLDYVEGGLENPTGSPHRFCWNCTFRAWADTATIDTATVTVDSLDAGSTTYPAELVGERWVVTGLELYNGDMVVVERGGVLDRHGNINGAPSNEVVIEGFRDRPVGPVETLLTYTGDTSETVGGRADVSAVLTSVDGAPLAGRTITFKRGRLKTSADTDGTGTAASTLRIAGPPGDSQPILVTFAGDDDAFASSLEVPFTASAKNGSTGTLEDAESTGASFPLTGMWAILLAALLGRSALTRILRSRS